MPLNHLALEARGFCVPGSYRNQTIEETVGETVFGRLLSQCTAKAEDEHIPSFSEGQTSSLAHL